MSIRAKAIAIIKDENKFLFTICKESSTGKNYYIPVGGGINFGEYSINAIKREFMEEVGLELIKLQLDASSAFIRFELISEENNCAIARKDPTKVS
jgi:ADP-ribose pyrophosphatase